MKYAKKTAPKDVIDAQYEDGNRDTGIRARKIAQTLESTPSYTITKEGKIRLKRDLKKWRAVKLGPNHWLYSSEAPALEKTREKDFAAVISRCTKELSLDQESAIAVQNMKKQEYLDQLAEI